MDGTGWADELELDGAGDCGDADAGDANAQSKRRRRIRNQKQQELNRLAQQRYRWVESLFTFQSNRYRSGF